ncbi:hypothetical protein ABL78_8366 [Leptomonas seymouri]|uniref:Uncharacterized protein n=1 Tax=Leptomonas seymouri TaxID=5684 RepID=A0A0N1IG29_LEPSE|nr:hypothetical protein ABL78_8366 [Leptomonas seymouri]|eukprot:KPI82624.1 hypothetical protein ABL78_8366 [Leptomonas seymouri]
MTARYGERAVNFTCCAPLLVNSIHLHFGISSVMFSALVMLAIASSIGPMRPRGAAGDANTDPLCCCSSGETSRSASA